VLIVRRRDLTFGRVRTLDRTGRIAAVTVAVDPTGATLAAWVRGSVVYARTLTGRTLGPIRRLGRTRPSPILRADALNGRSVVAWAGQRVVEGSPGGPFVARAAAARNGRFAATQTVGTVPGLDTGEYVGGARVQAVVLQDGRTQVAWTAYERGRFGVRAREIAGSHLDVTLIVSPPDQDAVFAALASGPANETALALVTGVRGADAAPGATPQLFAAVRSDGETAYSAPEPVSSGGSVDPNGVAIAIAPKTRRVIAAWRRVGSPIHFAWRQPVS
jgi:hypothetical protein